MELLLSAFRQEEDDEEFFMLPAISMVFGPPNNTYKRGFALSIQLGFWGVAMALIKHK